MSNTNSLCLTQTTIIPIMSVRSQKRHHWLLSHHWSHVDYHKSHHFSVHHALHSLKTVWTGRKRREWYRNKVKYHVSLLQKVAVLFQSGSDQMCALSNSFRWEQMAIVFIKSFRTSTEMSNHFGSNCLQSMTQGLLLLAKLHLDSKLLAKQRTHTIQMKCIQMAS